MSESRTDFEPLAPVVLVKPNGQRIGYGLGAADNAARGAAMLAAAAVAQSAAGHVILLGQGTFANATAISSSVVLTIRGSTNIGTIISGDVVADNLFFEQLQLTGTPSGSYVPRFPRLDVSLGVCYDLAHGESFDWCNRVALGSDEQVAIDYELRHLMDNSDPTLDWRAKQLIGNWSITGTLAGYQPLDADLTTIAGLTATTDNFIVSVGSAWASRTPAQVKTTLGLTVGTDVQAYDATLAAIAAYNTNGLLTQTAADTFAGRTLTGTANRVTVTNGDGVSGNPTLTVPDAAILNIDEITGTTEITVNEAGANLDFRIEGDTNANLFFTDASTDRIGIGTNSPAYMLDVFGAIRSTSGYNVSNSATFNLAASGAYMGWTGSPNTLLITTNAAHVPLVVQGVTSQSADLFQVKTVGGAATLFAIAASGNTTIAGDCIFSAVAKGLQFKTGTGQRAGNGTLVGGTLAITNTSVTANTVIILSRKTAGGTIGDLTYTLSAGASFTINSASGTDTSVVSYLLVEVA